MPSGKQILLSLLQQYSQRPLDVEEAREATERLRAGLLLHGSTADESWGRAERIAWVGRPDGVQGLGLERENLLLADLFEDIVESELPERVKKRHPSLSPEAYEHAVEIMWLLLSQLQFYDELARVENGGVLDEAASEHLIANYREKLGRYRADPRAYLGVIDEEDE